MSSSVNSNVKYALVVLAFTTIGLSAGIYLSLPPEPPFPTRSTAVLPRADTSIASADTEVNVEIVGDGIEKSGTYNLPADSEIIDLVERAGGISSGALTSGLDWHAKLYEGLTVTVPTQKVFRDARSGTRTLSNRDLIRFRSYQREAERQQTTPDLIELNEAGRDKLQELPGIGEVLAERIVEYRNENDGFDQVRDLKEIFGIGDVTFQELRAKVTVN